MSITVTSQETPRFQQEVENRCTLLCKDRRDVANEILEDIGKANWVLCGNPFVTLKSFSPIAQDQIKFAIATDNLPFQDAVTIVFKGLESESPPPPNPEEKPRRKLPAKPNIPKPSNKNLFLDFIREESIYHDDPEWDIGRVKRNQGPFAFILKNASLFDDPLFIQQFKSDTVCMSQFLHLFWCFVFHDFEFIKKGDETLFRGRAGYSQLPSPNFNGMLSYTLNRLRDLHNPAQH